MTDIGFVNAGSLLTVSPFLPESARQDVLFSLLYAQLTSSKTYPNLQDFNAWNTRYTEAQKFLCYNGSGRVRYGFFSTSPDKSVNLADVIQQGLKLLMAEGDMKSVEVLLSQVAALDVGNDSLKLLKRHAVQLDEDVQPGEKPVNRIRIQLGVVDKASRLTMVTVNLATHAPLDPHFFNQTFRLNEIVGDVESQYFVAQLDEDYVDLKRNMVIKALKGRDKEEINKLF